MAMVGLAERGRVDGVAHGLLSSRASFLSGLFNILKLPIQIRIQTGFSSPETMRRAFKRHVGVSASDYRARFRPANLATERQEGPP